MGASDHLITTMEQLQSLYGEKNPTSIAKEIDHINGSYRQLIEAAPFVAVATCGPEGLDCSPKGDARGFVRILDDKTLAIPQLARQIQSQRRAGLSGRSRLCVRKSFSRDSRICRNHPAAV